MTNKREKNAPRFAFFGTPELATVFLDDLSAGGLVPSLVVTASDKPQGRGMALTPPAVKVWAQVRSIPVLQPEQFDDTAAAALRAAACDFFVVIYYGKVLPRAVLDTPKRGILNVHFSLLPRWRGTSPVRAAIANDDKEIGTSIILLDEKLDHGPIIAQKKLVLHEWPPRASEVEELATRESAKLLLEILPSWLDSSIEPHAQNHDLATQCPKYTKEDGLLDLKGDAYKNLLKIRAFDTTIGTYAFFERNGKKFRVQILTAHMTNGPTPLNKAQGKPLRTSKLVIDSVKPEGKREMDYREFLRSGAQPTKN